MKPRVRHQRVGPGFLTKISSPIGNIDFDDPQEREAFIRFAFNSPRLISDERIPLDLAKAISAVQGLKVLLEGARKALAEKPLDQIAGLSEVEDLLIALVEGRYHPVLGEWQKSHRRNDKKWPGWNAIIVRAHLLAIAAELAKRQNPSTGREIGIVNARAQLAAAVNHFPGCETWTAKTIENWKSVDLPKMLGREFEADGHPKKDARIKADRTIRDLIKEANAFFGLEKLTAEELLGLARNRVARAMPSSKMLYGDQEYGLARDENT